MINIFKKNQKPFAKNDQKALAKNENFSKFKICKFFVAERTQGRGVRSALGALGHKKLQILNFENVHF